MIAGFGRALQRCCSKNTPGLRNPAIYRSASSPGQGQELDSAQKELDSPRGSSDITELSDEKGEVFANWNPC